MKMSYSWVLTLVLSCLLVGFRGGLAVQCGPDAGGALCPDGFCCSRWGYCGTTAAYCEGDNCQSQCWSPPPPPDPLARPQQMGLQVQCGEDAGGALCADGYCCSKWGYCGTTAAYCEGDNCQSQCWSPPPPPDPLARLKQMGLQVQCGEEAGGALCADGYCCSKWGFCGTTAAYCEGDNCQSQCWSPPPPPSPPPPSPPPPSPPPPSPPPPPPPSGGQCGEDAGGALCAEGYCCSKWGFCGTTAAYCEGDNCQSQCWSPPPPPDPLARPQQMGLQVQCGEEAGGALCADGYCCSKWGFCGTTAAYCEGDNCQSQCWSPPPPPSPPPPSPPPPSPPPPPPPSGGQCGEDAGGALCAEGYCCSKWGFCGTTAAYCEGDNCQSQCWSPPPPPPPPGSPPSGAITDIITSEMFDQLLPFRNDGRCHAKNFYTYDAFVAAAKFFPAFATTGDYATRIREVAAFLAQTSHETTGGWATAPGGPYAWGYCSVRKRGGGTYCVPNAEWPCAPGKSYYGRGPIQISYNYNYGPAGVALGVDLLNDPDLVKTNATISFEAALWFWMTPQSPKPSCHGVITGSWTPSATDVAEGRLPGYGVITNIINGGLECGHGSDKRVQNRIGFYEKFCQKLGVSTGDNLHCGNQRPFGSVGVLVDSI